MMDHKRRTDPVMLCFERQLAQGLFHREFYDEAVRVTEQDRTTAFGAYRALYVMWHETKVEARERCIAEAAAIVDAMCDSGWTSDHGVLVGRFEAHWKGGP